jgi:hypothetical protein
MQTENAFFARSAPMVVVLMETSSFADGYDHHGLRGRYEGEVSFYSLKRFAPQASLPHTDLWAMFK